MPWQEHKIKSLKKPVKAAPNVPRNLLEERVRARLEHEGIDQKYTKSLSDLLKQTGMDVDDVVFNSKESHVNVTEGNRVEYMVFPDIKDAKQFAVEKAKESIEEDPTVFEPNWIRHYVNTDKMVENLTDDILIMEQQSRETGLLRLMEDVGKDTVDLSAFDKKVREKFRQEYPDKPTRGVDVATMLDDLIGDGLIDKTDASDFFNYDSLVKEHADLKFNEIIAKDPIEYLDETKGKGEGLKFAVRFEAIDSEKAASDAISEEGIAAFLATFDQQEINLESGGVAFRVA